MAKKKKTKPIFTRGFTDVRKRIKKSARYTSSCDNCTFYEWDEELKEEACQNENVLEYDICIDLESNRVYCNYWRPESDENN